MNRVDQHYHYLSVLVMIVPESSTTYVSTLPIPGPIHVHCSDVAVTPWTVGFVGGRGSEKKQQFEI